MVRRPAGRRTAATWSSLARGLLGPGVAEIDDWDDRGDDRERQVRAKDRQERRYAVRPACTTARTASLTFAGFSSPYITIAAPLPVIGLKLTTTLVANSKMGEMTLSILTAEGQRNWVDTCA
jgi:hypothetical protein